jgi:hypothetical protein
VIVRSGDGQRVATERFAELLSLHFDAEVVPLLRIPARAMNRRAVAIPSSEPRERE